jgi:hypothetical protein
MDAHMSVWGGYVAQEEGKNTVGQALIIARRPGPSPSRREEKKNHSNRINNIRSNEPSTP